MITYGREVAGVLAAIDSAVCGRIQRDSTTQISLQPYKGRYFGVGGELVDISAGKTRVQSDNRIDAAGADAGAAAAVNTLYYVYLSNSLATFSPSSIRLSTVAPTTVNGVKYLGNSGNALNWRFLGWVRTISNGGTPNFADSVTQRLVINYYNRRVLQLRTCPGYVDDNAPTAITFAHPGGTGWFQLNGGTGDLLQYIDCGEETVQVDFYGAVALTDSAADVFTLGYGIDSTTVGAVHHSDQEFDGTSFGGSSYWHPQGIGYHNLAEGFHEINFLGFNQSPANSVTLYVDGGRVPGESVDSECTYIQAKVWG